MFVGLKPYEYSVMTPSEILKFHNAFVKRFELENELANRRTARICCLLANINRDKKHKKKPFTEDDFMPKVEKPKKRQTVKQMETVLKMLTIMNN